MNPILNLINCQTHNNNIENRHIHDEQQSTTKAPPPAFTLDGKRIVSISEDNAVHITWVGRNKRELLERARQHLPRELTKAEKRRYYLDVE